MQKCLYFQTRLVAGANQTLKTPLVRGGRGSHNGLDLARVDVADHTISKHLLSGLVADLGSVLTQEPANLSSGGLGVGAETVEPTRGGDVDDGGGVGDKLNSTIGIFADTALRVGMIGKIYGSEHNF